MGQSQCLAGIQALPFNFARARAGAAGNVPRRIRLRKLKNATNNFNVDHLIGEGWTAHVYRGTIKHQLVAIKRLKRAALINGNYLAELQMLTRLTHPNIIELIGFCRHEAERFAGTEHILVYEYMPLRSVHDLLHARRAGEGVLDWGTRMRIGAGVAKGLCYIHDEVQPPIVFRDLKSADVLLGQGHHPKISDFGHALNVLERGQTSVESGRPRDDQTRQTNPHWAPENAISHKADVYSFGVLLLELLTRERKFPETVPDQVMTPASFVEMADSELNGQFPNAEFIKAMSLAMLCMDNNPIARPDMSEVVLGMRNLAGELNAEWPVELNVAAV